MHPRWLLGVLAKYMMTTGMPRYENYPSEMGGSQNPPMHSNEESQQVCPAPHVSSAFEHRA